MHTKYYKCLLPFLALLGSLIQKIYNAPIASAFSRRFPPQLGGLLLSMRELQTEDNQSLLECQCSRWSSMWCVACFYQNYSKCGMGMFRIEVTEAVETFGAGLNLG